MKKVSSALEDYYRSIGIVNSGDVDKFYEIVKSHGAPKAGQEEARVGLVVQDASYPSNSSGVPRGVLVIRGNFDREKVLTMLRKNYDEHMIKTGHTPDFRENDISGGRMKAHKFLLQDRDRALTVISFGDCTLFSSAKNGDQGLLNATVRVVGANSNTPVSFGESSVTYTLNPDSRDKTLLAGQIDKKYEKYKQDLLRTSKRKGLKAFFTRKVADHKVKFIKDAIDELGQVTIDIYRMRNDSVNMKRMQLVSTFADDKTARKVKRKLLDHLNDAIKGSDNPEDKLGLSSNVRITVDGSRCIVDCEIGSEEDQIHSFALISSYVGRSILRN
jgi:hypothetical protein